MIIKKSKKVNIIGAPISIASPYKGASLGPDAIRLSGLYETLTNMNIEYIDSGNIYSLEEPYPPVEFEKGKIRYLDEVYKFCLELKEKVYNSIKNDYLPLVLGGDHSLAIGSIAGISKYYKEKNQEFGLIWFDAHADFNTEDTSPSGNIHGMPLAIASGLGNDKLKSIFENNFLDTKKIVIIGVRSVDPPEGKLINQYGIKVFTMKDIDEKGMLYCIKEAIKITSPNKNPIHLSFDIDGIDSLVIFGTGTPVMGGVTLREAHLMLEVLAETNLINSVDIVEVNPLLDNRNHTAEVAKSLLTSILGKVIF
ncbi:MAG: arginase [Candidatus Sericytochromatia bacterium]|nr:MAG: arginase [Candidatus Sericytochromatia bacterium]